MIVLGYKRMAPGFDSYQFGNVGETEKQFVRVCAGLGMPVNDRSHGALVVIGELLRPSGPQDFTALAATVGDWPEIQNTLIQYRQDLKYNYIITEPGKHIRERLWRIPGIGYGTGDISLLTYEAPAYAIEEASRQQVQSLIHEGRLHLEEVKTILQAAEPEEIARSLHSVLIWMIERKPNYQAGPRKPIPGTPWGTDGL